MTETRVNTYTTGLQAHSTVVALADGGWVVAWHSDSANGSPYDIYQQGYNADGTARGDEILVNTYTSNSQDLPVVTATADGGWVVAWMSAGIDTWNYGIEMQRFDSDATPLGDEISVNSYFSDNQIDPSIATLASGQFVVTWTSITEDGDGNGVYSRLFNADGSVATGEILVNSYTTSNQESSSVIALADGGWLVSWASSGQDGSGWGVYQQRFASDGTPSGTETVVNTYSTGDQTDPVVTALSDGGWVIAWTSTGQDGSYGGIYQRRYESTGVATGDEILVNTTTSFYQTSPAVSALADGGWVVVWTDSSRSSSDIYFQRYDHDGDAVGTEMQVNTYGSGEQVEPAVTALPSGGFIVTWSSKDQDGSDYGIYQQRFDADGVAYGHSNRPVSLISTMTGEQGYQNWFEASDFQFTDADSDALYSVTIVSLPTTGEFLFAGNAVTEGLTIRAADIYKLTYSAGEAGYGDNIASFEFKVTDDAGRTSEDAATMMIDITKANSSPQTVDDTAVMTEGQRKIIDVLANDSDADGDGLSISDLYVESKNAEVSVTSAGKLAVTYTGKDIAAGKHATIEIHYSASDGNTYADATLTVTVEGIAEPGDDIRGTASRDKLVGTNVGERLFGLAGNDRLDGRRGDDILIGGDGKDVFIFTRHGGSDVVRDFHWSGKQDRIDISDFASVDSYRDLVAHHMHEQAGNTYIDLGNTDIKLAGVDMDHLSRQDFIL